MQPLAGLKTARGSMSATATYAKRWWLWLTIPGSCCDGFLFLGQVKEKSYDVDEQTYGVEEVRSPFGPGWRSFSVRKLSAEEGAEDEQYTTSVGPRSSVCTCKSGRTRSEVCRHRDAFKAMIDAGVLPKKKLEGA